MIPLSKRGCIWVFSTCHCTVTIATLSMLAAAEWTAGGESAECRGYCK